MEDWSVAYIIGQAFGVLAVILGFVSYQMKTSKGLLILQSSVSVAFIIHFLLIGAPSGCVLNAVCLVRNIAYYFRDKKFLSGIWVPIVFTVLIAALGFSSWQGWFSLFMIAGLIINTIAIRFKNPQIIRASILVSSPLVIVYDVIVSSYGGIVYESVAILSSIIGLILYAKRGRASKAEKETQSAKDPPETE